MQEFLQPLLPEEERHYLILSRKGDINARNLLVEHNLRLVAHIVKKYQDRVIYDFYDTTGFQKLLDYNFSDVILMIFLFLCALPLFYQEQIYGMEDMILATKKGRKTYVAGKYISVIAVIIMYFT